MRVDFSIEFEPLKKGKDAFEKTKEFVKKVSQNAEYFAKEKIEEAEDFFDAMIAKTLKNEEFGFDTDSDDDSIEIIKLGDIMESIENTMKNSKEGFIIVEPEDESQDNYFIYIKKSD